MTSNIFVYIATFIKISHFYLTQLKRSINSPIISCDPTIRFEYEPKYSYYGTDFKLVVNTHVMSYKVQSSKYAINISCPIFLRNHYTWS